MVGGFTRLMLISTQVEVGVELGNFLNHGVIKFPKKSSILLLENRKNKLGVSCDMLRPAEVSFPLATRKLTLLRLPTITLC